jgi:aspartate carbamoyltransferase catalytic subunit
MRSPHLLSVKDLSREEILEVLDTARELSRITDGAIKKLPTLRGRTVVNLFFEDSTRTRLSFEAAAKRLSAEVINFSAKGSSVSKGESLKDTAQTLEAMGAELIIVRHSASGAAARLAESGWVKSHIVNAGDGMHEHPTQALLDAFTIRAHFPEHDQDFSGLRVGIVGDILHSRVARSNVLLLTALGAQVVLIAPPTLIPLGVESWPVQISYSLDDEIASLDAVMMLRVQGERMNDAFFPSEREYARDFGLGAQRLKALKRSAIIMHPGPMNRGLEISAASADSAHSVILEQVTNGVVVRMAVLYLLMGGSSIPKEGVLV